MAAWASTTSKAAPATTPTPSITPSDVLVEVSGIDLVRSTVTKTLATGFENLTLLGTVGLSGSGNAAANILTGNAGANMLSGLGRQ